MFKKLLLYVFFLLGLSLSSSAQKVIYITLDVSPSMYNKKYDLANYGAQMLSILNQDKDVYLIINSKVIPLSGDFTIIQKEVNSFGGFANSEIWDIDKLNETANLKLKGQDVFIIGDGIWHGPNERKDVYSGLSKLYNSDNFKVTFLEVLATRNQKAPFGTYLRDKNIGKIYTVTSTSEIIEAINEITEEITGVSAIPTNLLNYNSGNNSVSIKAELAIKGLKILYQDKSTIEKLPEIASIKANGENINIQNIGNPSNSSFESKTGGLMSARIYETKKKIPKDAVIEIEFSGAIKPEQLKVYPSSEVEIGSLNIAIANGRVSQGDDEYTMGVCEENEEVGISFEFNQQGVAVTNGIIEKAKVTFISNGKRYPAKYEGGSFRAVIPLTGKTTTYQIESEVEGYFKELTGIRKIVKTKNCAPPSGGVKKMGKVNIGQIALGKLIRDGRITSVIVDENTGASINPEHFDIQLKNNYPTLFKSIKIEFKENDSFDLIVEPRGIWCDCFMPNQLIIDFKAAPKKGYLIDGKQYSSMDYDLVVDIIKEESWFSRCKWLLIAMLGSLGLAWILILISRKNRFARGSRVSFRFPSMTSRRSLNPEFETTDFLLRKRGLIAWLNRWFNPFSAEKNTLTFSNINMTMQFIAASSIRHVLFPKVSFDEKTMDCVNYDPDRPDKFVKFDESSEIRVEYSQGIMGKSTNYLEYNYPKKSWNDIAGFRFSLGILIAGLLIFFGISLILIIRSLF